MKKGRSNIYSNKLRWKIVLFTLALLVVGGSLIVSNWMVTKIAVKEKAKAKQWAQAIQKKAELVRFSQQSFKSLQEKERERIQLIVEAQKTLLKPSDLDVNQDVDFAMSIINGNKNIPVILLDDRNKISQYKNIDSSLLPVDRLLRDSLLIKLALEWKEAQRFFIIEVFEGFNMTYVYDESNILKSLKRASDSLISTFNHDLISDTRLMPVILMDSSKKTVIASNLNESPQEAVKKMAIFQTRNEPIAIDLGTQRQWLFYDQSPEVKQLRWFPYIQLGLVAFVVLIGYIVFSTFRRAEQNQVWAGMAKETAHQLGTPISSLSAWIDYLDSQPVEKDSLVEMKKDLMRLEMVTDRFSKIGSETKLVNEDIVVTVTHIIEYLSPRLSKKVELLVENTHDQIVVPHNASLMEWVIENITKNAVDAMEGSGKFKVSFTKNQKGVCIDLEDSGKGLSKKQFNSIFQPGYSTKRRGWGLGLSLAKRIVETYHHGRIFVLRSEINKGTTFRIFLPL